MPLSEKEVGKIADLSNLRFAPHELGRFVHQFQKILDYFAQLEGVSTEEIAPMYHALQQESPETPTRQDKTRPSFPPEVALANAPDPADQCFRVPKVIED